MSAAARAGIVVLMVLIVLTARLIETELARARQGEHDAVQLPPADVPTVAAVAAPARAGGDARSVAAGGSQAVAADGSRSYVVARNETLGAISKRFYGTSRHWKVILAANGDTLRKATDLREGQTIRIPPRPE